MKKGLFLIALAIGVCTISNAQFVPDTVKVLRTETAPEIDGTIEAAWDLAPVMQIAFWGMEEDGETQKPAPAADDFFPTYKMLWDDDYVYFLGIIVDDHVTTMDEYAENLSEDWETDNWETYWAPSNSQLADNSELMQIRTSFANKGKEDGSADVVNGWNPNFVVEDFVTAARTETSDGWVLEAKFALAELASSVDLESLGEGSVLGFNTCPCDNDNEEKRKHIGTLVEDGFQYDSGDTIHVIQLVSSTVGIKNNDVLSNVSIYPNPTTGDFNVSSDLNINSIEVINTLGAVVYSNNEFNNQANLSELVTGMYMVKMYSNEELVGFQKLIKK